MNYSCLSAASVLRCEALSRVQSGIAFIPCVLQIFILFLLLYIRGTNRCVIVLARYMISTKTSFHCSWKWLLIGESSATFVLTLVDLLSHVLPQAQSSLGVFKAFDIAIGEFQLLPCSPALLTCCCDGQLLCLSSPSSSILSFFMDLLANRAFAFSRKGAKPSRTRFLSSSCFSSSSRMNSDHLLASHDVR